MVCNFELNDKLILSDTARVRNEAFGKLIVSKGVSTLCLNEAASYIVDLCDGTLSAQEIIKKIALFVQTDDERSLSSKIEKILDALCGVNVLVIKR